MTAHRAGQIALPAALLTLSCVRITENNPTAPTPISVTTTQTQTVTSPTPIVVVPPGGGTNPTTPTNPTNPTNPIGRTPDPVAGSYLPLPALGQSVPSAVAMLQPELLAHSCVTTYGPDAWGFLDAVVDTLRQFDSRWGYACGVGGDCFNPIPDAVAYHATAGPEVVGVQGVWIVDVVESYCLVNPSAAWNSLGYQPGARWTSRNRF